uniref:FTH domain-containing protein n=1 Tax=Rhabditophanes sp. KR3021 TaxID=114890 RepID=A0AC35U4U4_9BILA
MFALRKTCRNLYRVIERQRLTNSIDSTTLTVEFINVLAIHPGLKSFGGRISNQDAFMEEDFLLERIREVCVSETQYVDCLKIDLNFEFSHTDDLLNTLIDDRKDALKMFAKKAARLTKEIIRKYPDVTSLCFERIYGMFPDFGKRVADKYPHLKAIGIVGVEDEENEQYFNKFGNLEFLVINRIKTQMVIPESVRVVVQNIYSDKYDNICTFINQDSGLEMNFNIQFHLVDDRKSKRVYARTVADLELYLTMLDFADICLLQYNALNTDCKAY